MKTQSFKNHIRFYPAHHFVFYPIISILFGCSLYFSFTTENQLLWLFLSAILLLLFALAFMLRQHYALVLQNRIIRLELCYRYFSLTGKRFEIFELQLEDHQIFALRFAPDDELVFLIEKTLAENWSGNTIKKNIMNWNGDYHRV